MKPNLFIILVGLGLLGADWKTATPGWQSEFPRDHHVHRSFKTEWWYFTGNLFDHEDRRFGYELTFFRQGVRPAGEGEPKRSRFVIDDLKFAHFAMTSLSDQRFRFEQKMSRGAFGEAGFGDDGNRLAWLENWSLESDGADSFELKAAGSVGKIQLHLRNVKLPVVHGENGISTKSSENGHASHYYSIPRLETTGELLINGKPHSVRGESWFDHEWATGQLAENQAGWDWLCVQWEDGTELMLYRMRLKNGEVDSSSSGTWIAQDGVATHLHSSDFQMTPIGFWKSKVSGAQYPTSWRIRIPEHRREFVVSAVLEDQELSLGQITYWEGAIDASSGKDNEMKGRGYLELTGYAGGIGGLTR